MKEWEDGNSIQYDVKYRKYGTKQELYDIKSNKLSQSKWMGSLFFELTSK